MRLTMDIRSVEVRGDIVYFTAEIGGNVYTSQASSCEGVMFGKVIRTIEWLEDFNKGLRIALDQTNINSLRIALNDKLKDI